MLDVPDLGARIQEGLGIKVDDVQSSEVVLVTFMPDDSGSIQFAGNAQVVRDGHNLVLDALARVEPARRDPRAQPLPQRPRALPVLPDRAGSADDRSRTTHPDRGTPLYDQTVVLLGTVIAKTQEFAGSGVPARTVTLIITDGGDQGSTRAKAKDVKAIVRDMLAAENHIVAAMGVDDGTTNFRDVFRAMGIEDRWILTPGNDAAEIRKAFLVFSQSAVKASQGGASFSRTAAGGFGK